MATLGIALFALMDAVMKGLATDLGAELPSFVDLRDRAGWSDENSDAGPKMAALLAESQLPEHSGKSIDVSSGGVCLVIGRADVALPAAEALAEHLSVTALLDEEPELSLPRGYDVAIGKLNRAKLNGITDRKTRATSAWHGVSVPVILWRLSGTT